MFLFSKCRDCGHEVRKNSPYCPHCGVISPSARSFSVLTGAPKAKGGLLPVLGALGSIIFVALITRNPTGTVGAEKAKEPSFVVSRPTGVEGNSGQVEFDPQANIKKRLVEGVFDRAETCVHGILLVNLLTGVRDREALVSTAAAQCENNFRASLIQIDPRLADKVPTRATLTAFALRQIDVILANGE
jgi:hypothetical protein